MLGKFFNGNPFASVTIASVLSLLGGYLVAHLDPTKLTPTGLTVWTVVTSIIAVVTHHSNKPVAP